MIENKVSVGISGDAQDDQDFVYLQPNQLHHSNMQLQENDV